MIHWVKYPGFVSKALALSYDDGTFYDVLLVEELNRAGLKCSFNINSGLFGAIADLYMGDLRIFHNRISRDQSVCLYKGHEICSHSVSHPILAGQNREVCELQVGRDQAALEALFGQKIVGFAYPGGPFDEPLNDYLREKFLYARTGDSTLSFDLPESLIPFRPTVFHLHPQFRELCAKYLELESPKLSLFSVWGHSYEFAIPGVFDNFKAMCTEFSGRKDVFQAALGEILGYLHAAKSLTLNAASDRLCNGSGQSLYLELGGKRVILAPGESTALTRPQRKEFEESQR